MFFCAIPSSLIRRCGLSQGLKHFSSSQNIRPLSTKRTAEEDDEHSDAVDSPPAPICVSKSTLLYKANSSKARFPRGLFGFSLVHSGYWSWYVLDFTPALKATAVDPSTIDSTVGYLGLGLSIFMSIGSMIYPKSLVSEISLNEANRSLQVKTFSVPFVMPSKPVEYQLGDLVIDSPNDVTKILTDYNGLISMFPGHMALHAEGKFTNLLMNMKEDANEEILENKLLLQSLMPGQAKGHLSDAALNGKKVHGENIENDAFNTKTLKLKIKRKRVSKRKVKYT